jgi:hypothetical protein
MAVFVLLFASAFFMAGTAGDVKLATDYRVDSPIPASGIEVKRAKHVAVIGKGEMFHAEFARSIYQRRDACSAVKKRVIGMIVQMDEILHIPSLMSRISSKVQNHNKKAFSVCKEK